MISSGGLRLAGNLRVIWHVAYRKMARSDSAAYVARHVPGPIIRRFPQASSRPKRHPVSPLVLPRNQTDGEEDYDENGEEAGRTRTRREGDDGEEGREGTRRGRTSRSSTPPRKETVNYTVFTRCSQLERQEEDRCRLPSGLLQNPGNGPE